MFDQDRRFGWRLGVLAGLAMTLLSLLPQAHLWYKRGADWQGTYAYFYSDEPAYAAYVNALVDGRPRRNDPYTGRDDEASAPQAESLFSIQFIPPYLLALPARVFNLRTPVMFILIMPFIAFASSCAIFGLTRSLTGDERVAAVAVFFTLCLGILISGQGLAVNLTGAMPAYVYLPFLRRYVPGVPFVFFLFFCLSLWHALSADARRGRLLCAAVAGVLFALMVYSYFYHWTAAAALAGCAALLWLVARPDNWRAAIAPLAVVAACALASLVPYFILLARRAPTMDKVQVLVYSRAPDLWRGVILLDVIVLAALLYGVRRRWLDGRDRAVLFNASLTLTVLVVFNQQIITGRSLQPMHYEQYIGNYVVLLAASIAAGLLWHGRAKHKRALTQGATADAPTPLHAPSLMPHRLWLPVALAAFLWGAGETLVATKKFAAGNFTRDEWGGVTNWLREHADDIERTALAPRGVVFNPSIFRTDNIPAATPLSVVWAPHMFVFSGVTVEENKERFFQYLYFSGVAADGFAADYRDRGFIQFAIFGWERANPRLTINPKPVTPEEIMAEQRNYADYIASFTRDIAARLPLSYVVISADQPFDHSHLDRWYERHPVALIGRHTIYRVKLRN
ncbi:MAG: hypothetical protein ACR2G4_16140 [Pyrinomonadaceae bacterium]